MVLRVSPVDGEAKAYILGEPIGHEGQWQRGIKYFQHAYSSYLGWCALGEGGPDLGAGRTGVSFDGENWHYRTNPEPVVVDAFHSVSRYRFVLNTPQKELEDFGNVTTHTLIGENGELHVFWHDSARPLYLWLGGYGISVPTSEKPQIESGDGLLSVSAGQYHSVIKIIEGPAGELDTRFLTPREGWTSAHIFGGNGVFPFWRSKVPVRSNTVVAAYVAGNRQRPAQIPDIDVQRVPDCMKISFEGLKYSIPLPD